MAKDKERTYTKEEVEAIIKESLLIGLLRGNISVEGTFKRGAENTNRLLGVLYRMNINKLL